MPYVFKNFLSLSLIKRSGTYFCFQTLARDTQGTGDGACWAYEVQLCPPSLCNTLSARTAQQEGSRAPRKRAPGPHLTASAPLPSRQSGSGTVCIPLPGGQKKPLLALGSYVALGGPQNSVGARGLSESGRGGQAPSTVPDTLGCRLSLP